MKSEKQLTSLEEAIQVIGTGKHGSDDLSQEQVDALLAHFNKRSVNLIQLGAFLGALSQKGVAETESVLFSYFNCDSKTFNQLIQNALPQISEEAQKWCETIASKEILSFDTALRLGQFLFFTNEQDDPARGFIASALRVRYTEPHEYAGIYAALQKTITFQPTQEHNLPIAQIAEPFDGVERSILLTPLIANLFHNKGYNVVLPCGESSGPKFGFNLLRLAKEMELPLNETHILARNQFGNYYSQEFLSSALHRWVGIRKQTMKRPFLATLEKYVTIKKPTLFVASAFHNTFTDKMVEVAQAIGFHDIIVTFKSVEGTLGLSLARSTKVFISTRKTNNEYHSLEVDFKPEDFGLSKMTDTNYDEKQIQNSASLLTNFIQHGSTLDEYIDLRINYTLKVFERAYEILKEEKQKLTRHQEQTSASIY